MTASNNRYKISLTQSYKSVITETVSLNEPVTPTSTILEGNDSSSLNISNNALQIQKLKSFLKLGENWDSYNASRISEEAVNSAIDFVKRLDEKYHLVYFVAPGPNGEVLVELKDANRSIEVVFEEDSNEYVKFQEQEVADEGEYTEEMDSMFISWLMNG